MTPCYVIYEDKLRANLELVARVARESGAKIIMAFKANAAWRTFGMLREHGIGFTASSLNELRLGMEELGGEAHVYAPAYAREEIHEFLSHGTHITFNSVAQYLKYSGEVQKAVISPGLRVNPECSVIKTAIYNPALPGSRLGMTREMLDKAGGLPRGIKGLHFHALCESSARDLEKVLKAFEDKFGDCVPGLEWVNFGGGHLMTRKGYDVERLIRIIRDFRRHHDGLRVILEPGSAFTWQTGVLEAAVEDVVDNGGIKTAILNVSFACHMPDCLEMPYQPVVSQCSDHGQHVYRLGGCSCLNGDVCPGEFRFDRELKPGQRLTFEDMNHYTTVKTTMFNGVAHPDLVLQRSDGSRELLRHYDYSDYKSRMD